MAPPSKNKPNHYQLLQLPLKQSSEWPKPITPLQCMVSE